MRWQAFVERAGELGELAEERIVRPELALLGTLRADGSPRISPCEVYVVDGELLLGMMWQSRKARDLVRDPRIVVHSTQSEKSGAQPDVKVYGAVIDVPEPATFVDAQGLSADQYRSLTVSSKVGMALLDGTVVGALL